MTDLLLTTWTDVCGLDDLIPGRGVAALVGGEQVAVFRWDDDTVFALSNYDPFSGANVLSRGIVGSRGDAPKVSSPVYKQSFDLRTGACFDDATVHLTTFPTRVVGGRIEIGAR
ncbi:MAG TPA: nitrite reductase small subunit NirD [Acidimicrobiales bacterium]|nr:nitrite reductase small subunit NirD [Acidimicrobiales bacterium]